MKQFAYDLLIKINNEIQALDLEEPDIFKKSLKITSFLEEVFNELKVCVLDYSFKSEDEEIQFFKETKPQIMSQLIYYSTICRIEINRPTGNSTMQKAYISKQFEKLNKFCIENSVFCQYYRAGRTDLDANLFLRGTADKHQTLDSFYFERDPKFSTGFDFKVARILANDMLSVYLNDELYRIDQPKTLQSETILLKTKETWTGSKVALVELIYAIHTSGSINYGKCDLKRLTRYFESVFNIELGDVYRTFLEIRGRKGNRVQYLDELRKNLLDRMDDVDGK